jgi:hypothetical protein
MLYIFKHVVNVIKIKQCVISFLVQGEKTQDFISRYLGKEEAEKRDDLL